MRIEEMFVLVSRNETFRDSGTSCVCLLFSEKRVGNVYSKAKSFVDYVRRALRRLELDELKVWDQNITVILQNGFQKQTY